MRRARSESRSDLKPRRHASPARDEPRCYVDLLDMEVVCEDKEGIKTYPIIEVDPTEALDELLQVLENAVREGKISIDLAVKIFRMAEDWFGYRTPEEQVRQWFEEAKGG